MSTTKPGNIRIWAEAGAITDPGNAKYNTGWIVEIPTLQNMNYIQQQITQMLKHVNEEGIPRWDSTTDYPIGGMTKGVDNKIYTAITNNIGQDPSGGGNTNWDEFASGGDSNQLVRAQMNVTVGSGGDYATITEAITALSEFTPIYKKGGIWGRIELKTGFIIDEELHFDSVDLGWIVIDSEQGMIPHTLRSAAIVTDFDSEGRGCFFGARNNATSPLINFAFKFDTPNSGPQKHGIYALWGASINIFETKVLDAGGTAIGAHSGSQISIRQPLDVTGSKGTGIFCGIGSGIHCYGDVTANNCSVGVLAGRGSTVSVKGTIRASNCVEGVNASWGATISAWHIEANNCEHFGVHARGAGSNISVDQTITANDAGDGGGVNGHAVLAGQNSTITAIDKITALRADMNGILAVGDGCVTSIEISARKGAGDISSDIQVEYGGRILMGTRTGGTSITPGTYNADGYINL